MTGANNNDFELVLVSPDKILLETRALKVLVPGSAQELAILPNHTPLYSLLNKGKVMVTNFDNNIKEIEIEGGIIRVRQNRVSIVLGFENDGKKR